MQLSRLYFLVCLLTTKNKEAKIRSNFLEKLNECLGLIKADKEDDPDANNDPVSMEDVFDELEQSKRKLQGVNLGIGFLANPQILVSDSLY